MLTNGCVAAERKDDVTKKRFFRGLFFMNAFADEVDDDEFEVEEEGTPDPSPSKKKSKSAGMTVNIEELMATARKEEKAKLYPRIKKLEGDKTSLTNSLNEALMREGALKKQLEESESGDNGESRIAALEKELADAKKEVEELKSKTPPDEGVIRSQVEAEFAVKMYAKEQLEANKDDILTMFHADITGTTNEEVDAAIAAAKEKTSSIKKDLGIDESTSKKSKKDEGEPNSQKQSNTRKTPRSVSPAQEGGSAEFDLEYIRNLDPRSKEYQEFRKKMGLK